MRNLVEMAIEREAERLDALLESPDVLEAAAYPWSPIRDRLNPLTHRFMARGTRRRIVAAKAPVPRFIH